ncbi:homocysteine S-methyltransferase family protein [Aurantiacibacter hainanensis]|uniref:homocysteine S-methyltransferase family protein n=1 Tax=Aurantiacibacter hainanensis TaxID=3076114 RepID=UPI0030C772F8
MSAFEQLMKTRKPFLTDGGLETWLFFQQGFEAPEFAALAVIDDSAARAALDRYFDDFLALAEQARTGFVLDTTTWRGCTVWAERLGVSEHELLAMTGRSVEFANQVRERWQSRVDPILVNGVVGPAGDGYRPGEVPSAQHAADLHRPQIEALANAGVDMISAITITNIGEAVGIVADAVSVGLPVVVSFTVETDGLLPTGDLLGEAIEAVDAATGGAPAYYMINCAHPDHFRNAIASEERWIERIGGLRANASRLSHEELDGAEELDQGDPEEFGLLHGDLAGLLPNLRVVGGCCGTDTRHVRCVSAELIFEQPVC